jgi:hypothetical protein
MKRKTEKQELPPVDRFTLYARIKRLGITQLYLADKLNRDKSGITRAMDGGNETLLRRIDRHVSYLERQKELKASVSRASSKLHSINNSAHERVSQINQNPSQPVAQS